MSIGDKNEHYITINHHHQSSPSIITILVAKKRYAI